jgi:hypothetical protein
MERPRVLLAIMPQPKPISAMSDEERHAFATRLVNAAKSAMPPADQAEDRATPDERPA